MKSLLSSLFVLFLLMPASAFALESNDTLYGDQWYLHRVSAPEAWNTTTGSRNVVVAVLDSGVDIWHEDLEANIWVNKNEIAGNGMDDDGNGLTDDVWGYDFVRNESLPMPIVNVQNINPASVSHGTLVAGIIGAVGNNGIGVTGVAWNVQIMSVRVLDEQGDGSGSIIAKGIRYAVDQGAHVINLSFSGSVNDTSIANALKYAYNNNVVVVSAAGNEGLDMHDVPAYPACTPADEGEDWVIGVAASDRFDERAYFSNYGKDCIDITAPGTSFTGVAYFDADYGYTDAYVSGWSGTSLAAPVVSGAISLLLAHYPTLTPAQIKTVLQLSADPVAGEYRAEMGAGRLNIARALDVAGTIAVENAPLVEETTPPEMPPVTDWDFVKIDGNSTVYALLADGTRRMVLNASIFFMYADSFSEIRTISASLLSTYKLSGVVLPPAERVLVKIQSDPKVYWLARNYADAYRPILRPIPDEETARALFGQDWNQYIIDIDVAMFDKFDRGTAVESSEILNTTDLIKRSDLIKI